MARSVEEWVGKDDDAMPPPRVRIRIFDTHGGKCRICGRLIRGGEYWQQGHIVALCNGGPNRESNMSPECRTCCYAKTAEDIAEKSKVARIRSKHLGVKTKKPWPKRLNPWGTKKPPVP